MTKREIERLGRQGGRDDVNEYLDRLAEEGYDRTEIEERLLMTLAPGHLAWDEDAINMGVAEIVGVYGQRNRERFYAAYNRGAEERIAELTGGRSE